MSSFRAGLLAFLLVAAWNSTGLVAQQAERPKDTEAPQPFQEQSSSTLEYHIQDGAESVEIRNSTYEVSGTQVPGRPSGGRLVIRKSVHSKQILGEIGMDATTTFEAWPLGTNLKTKPLYAITVEGSDGRTVDDSLVEVSRGLEEVDWWSVYQLGTGKHLFDTYVPLVRFSISRETLALRYVGLEIPPDDAADPRLRDPHVVAVLSYASGENLIREALLTCDDPQQAQALRSYSDETHAVSWVEVPSSSPRGVMRSEPSQFIKIAFSQNYPSPPNTITVFIPLEGDDLEFDHAKLPAHLHLAKWHR